MDPGHLISEAVLLPGPLSHKALDKHHHADGPKFQFLLGPPVLVSAKIIRATFYNNVVKETEQGLMTGPRPKYLLTEPQLKLRKSDFSLVVFLVHSELIFKIRATVWAVLFHSYTIYYKKQLKSHFRFCRLETIINEYLRNILKGKCLFW